MMKRLWRPGYDIDPPAFEALFRSFDSDSDGRLGLPEFIALQLFLRRLDTHAMHSTQSYPGFI